MTVVFRWAFISLQFCCICLGKFSLMCLRWLFWDYAVSCQPLSPALLWGQTAVRDFSVRSQTVSFPCLPSPLPVCGSHHTRSEEGVGLALNYSPLTHCFSGTRTLCSFKECPLLPPQGVCTCCAISLRHFSWCIWMPRTLIYLFIQCYLPEWVSLTLSLPLHYFFFLALLTSRYCLD